MPWSPHSSEIVLPPPHFFTIILKKNLEHKKLMIPRKFLRDYGNFLSNSVNLKLPDGTKWEVGLTTETNGAVWLQNGWHRFAEYYDLKFGSLLVFRFDGTSTFHTIIFDETATEIEYCSNFDDSDECLEGFHRHSEKREKASFPCRKKVKIEDSFSPKMEPHQEEGYNISRDDMPICMIMPEDGDGVSKRRKQLATKAEAAEQRFSSKSEKPGFEVVMKQSNIGGKFDMIIPTEFAGTYLAEEFGTIKVQTSNARTWSLLYKWSQNRGHNFAYFSCGWKRFVAENLLKEGDVGFFQLIEKDQFLFTKQQPSASHSLSPEKKAPTTRNPSFKVDIHFSNCRISSTLNIPMSFAKEHHLSPEMHTAKLQVGNKQWEVKLKQYGTRFIMSAGWTKFCRENDLENSSCLFEMVNKKYCVFKVTIFKNVTSSASEEDQVL